MLDQTITVQGIEVNLSPDAFDRMAKHLYKCEQDFKSPDGFSPLPYFLLARSIELRLKALHLKVMKQPQVKKQFGHDLLGAYDALDPTQQILDATERTVLEQVNTIYKAKGFEYFVPMDALTGFTRYPTLSELDAIAEKLLSI